MTRKQKMIRKVLDSYKIPSKEILRHRNVFFGLWRRSDDQTTTWLKRVQNCIRRCEFPTNIIELLVFNRFVSGLNSNELKSIQKAKKSWTLKQLLEHFSKKNNDTMYIEAALITDENSHQIENITLDVVKIEPVCKLNMFFFICEILSKHFSFVLLYFQNKEECSENDPLNELKEGAGSLANRKFLENLIANVIEKEVKKAPKDVIPRSSDSERTNYQPELYEEIDNEMLNSGGMEFECVSVLLNLVHVDCFLSRFL